MTLTNVLGTIAILGIIAAIIDAIVNPAKGTGNYKTNTLQAMESANSKHYQKIVKSHKAQTQVYTEVIDDMINDPFWSEIIIDAVNNK